MMEINTGIDNNDAGSQDLFSSQATSSQGTNIQEQIDITLQLTEYIWVQCDHPNCQKWRRIPTACGEDLGDEPWYCSMNPDLNMNTCEATEEDHRRYDRMAKKAGVKFVMSMLNVGSLVWARTTGYCRWPGIITPDPMTGVHIHLDIDGDPHSYHVEYLGSPHTHSWVTAKYVEVYGHKEDEKTVTKIVKTGLKRGRKKQNKPSIDVNGSNKTNWISKTKQRTSYRRTRVDDVMREADYLLDMTLDERMNFSVFKYDPKRAVMLEYSAEKSSKKCSNCGENPSRKKRKLNQTCESSQGICNLLDNHAVSKKSGAGKKSGGEKKFSSSKNFNKKTLMSPARQTTMVELSAAKPHTVGSGSSDSPNQFSQSKLKISSSMMNVTKEEKFKIDIDVYMKNEKAFEHDVRRFMTRNNRTIRSTPIWHNVPVSLFQLYLAVHERGGFQKVTENKGWTGIYKELTDMHNAKTGAVAKHYYERNLYPYELFISGKDYAAALEKFPVLKPGQKRKSEETGGKSSLDVNNNNATENVTSDYASYCSDIEAILTQLDEDYKAAISTDECKVELKKKLGVGLTYHDETPSTPSAKFASVPSEFHQKQTLQGGSLIPASGIAVEQKILDATIDDEDLSLDVVEEKILTEMKALEDQMREMNEEIGELLD